MHACMHTQTHTQTHMHRKHTFYNHNIDTVLVRIYSLLCAHASNLLKAVSWYLANSVVML